jgi:hypothetical protein
MVQIVIKAFNRYHLGDNLFNIIFFNNIAKYLEKNNIIIQYYLNPNYFNQIQEFMQTNNVVLLDYNSTTEDNMGIHLWIDEPTHKLKFCDYCLHNDKRRPVPYNLFLMLFYKQILEIWKLPISINSIIYDDNNLIERYNNLNEKYKNIDVLFINSNPLSGQYVYDENEWIQFIRHFWKYNIVTTNKINRMPHLKCTTDDNLTIKDIAAISTKCKIVIFVNSGVMPGLFNIHTMNNVKQFYCLDNRTYYYFPRFQKFKNYKELKYISIKDIKNILNTQ